jgi:cytochrome c peroxidase
MKLGLKHLLFIAVAFSTTLLLSHSVMSQDSTWERKLVVPEDNPMTPEKIELGRKLYFDPRLSYSGTISCNSCHNVMAGGDDGVRSSFGIKGQRGNRNAPTVWNAAFLSVQFWDGRAATLEEQALGPLVNPVEMGLPGHHVAIERISKIPDYKDEFKKVFGGKKPLTIENVGKAIAAFERTLITTDSPFDKYIAGDKKAISEQAARGYKTFQEIGCTTCHSGPNFAGPTLPMGVGFYQKFPTFPNEALEKKYGFSKDLGRFDVTKQETDKNMWRVPTLRNVAITSPYFHNGSVDNLEDAVRIMAKVQLNKDLTSRQAKDLVAFLETLTGEFPMIPLPRLPMTYGTRTVED